MKMNRKSVNLGMSVVSAMFLAIALVSNSRADGGGAAAALRDTAVENLRGPIRLTLKHDLFLSDRWIQTGGQGPIRKFKEFAGLSAPSSACFFQPSTNDRELRSEMTFDARLSSVNLVSHGKKTYRFNLQPWSMESEQEVHAYRSARYEFVLQPLEGKPIYLVCVSRANELEYRASWWNNGGGNAVVHALNLDDYFPLGVFELKALLRDDFDIRIDEI